MNSSSRSSMARAQRREVPAAMALYGLLGQDVARSPSPAMHNAAFHRLGLHAVYVALSVPPPKLAEAFAGLRALWAGFNVTMPYKVEALAHVDWLSEEARLAGALNTVVNREGRLLAYNTDVDGVTFALGARRVEVRGKSALLVGAGGAARAVLVALRAQGLGEVLICNRSRERAEQLVGLARALDLDARYRPLEWLSSAEGDFGLLVNATPLLLGVEVPISPRLLMGTGAVLDLLYRPPKTPLLKLAARLSSKAVPGHLMLLGQAARAFELWTGRRAPLLLMHAVLRRELGLEG